jgi:hypothetical protein
MYLHTHSTKIKPVVCEIFVKNNSHGMLFSVPQNPWVISVPRHTECLMARFILYPTIHEIRASMYIFRVHLFERINSARDFFMQICWQINPAVWDIFQSASSHKHLCVQHKKERAHEKAYYSNNNLICMFIMSCTTAATIVVIQCDAYNTWCRTQYVYIIICVLFFVKTILPCRDCLMNLYVCNVWITCRGGGSGGWVFVEYYFLATSK